MDSDAFACNIIACMTDSQKTIERLIETAIDVELQIASLYEAFSDMFPQVPGLAAFWNSMKRDEMEHVTILEETRGLLTSEKLSAEAPSKTWDDIFGVQSMLKQNQLETIHTLDDAYELAHEIESSEANAILELLSFEAFARAKRRQLVHLIIDHHLEKLTDFSRSFGDRESRKRVRRNV